MRFTGGDYKVPHMGWNSLQFNNPEHPLFAGLEEGHAYFLFAVLGSADMDAEPGLCVVLVLGRQAVCTTLYEKSVQLFVGEYAMADILFALRLAVHRAG